MLLSTFWATIGLLGLGVSASGEARHNGAVLATTTVLDPTCTANVTVYSSEVIISKSTKNVEVVVPHTVNITTTQTETCTVQITEYTTKILIATAYSTQTLPVTTYTTQVLPVTSYTTIVLPVTNYTTTTSTSSTTTTTTTSTTSTTSTTTTTSTTISTTTSTTLTSSTTTTTTILATKEDPCPTRCSISAATVNLLFWPTDRPHTYPSTYLDRRYNYTFTSPSVYMYVPTARGLNSLGQRDGPETANWMVPLRLEDVSTIFSGTSTRQLSLSDLRTDCPQTADAAEVATMVNSACDPILAAPRQVSAWAYPCNACQRFGLFDPPYAVPTLPGLFPTTTTMAPAPTVTVMPPVTTPPVGVLLIVYYSDGVPMATATITTTGITGTVTSSVQISASSTARPVPTGPSSPPASSSSTRTSPPASPSVTSSSPVPPPTTRPPPTVTAAAHSNKSGFAWMTLSLLIAVYLL